VIAALRHKVYKTLRVAMEFSLQFEWYCG